MDRLTHADRARLRAIVEQLDLPLDAAAEQALRADVAAIVAPGRGQVISVAFGRAPSGTVVSATTDLERGWADARRLREACRR